VVSREAQGTVSGGVGRFDDRAGYGRALPMVGRFFRPAPRSDLSCRVALLTRAGRSPGAEVARQAHARGASVSLIGRRIGPLQDLVSELSDRAGALLADMTDAEGMQRATDATVARFGGTDAHTATQLLARPQVRRSCQARPSCVTTSISVQADGHTVIDAIRRRSARLRSPGRIAPAPAFRSPNTALTDEHLIRNSSFCPDHSRHRTRTHPGRASGLRADVRTRIRRDACRPTMIGRAPAALSAGGDQ
jgi:hypothetical protein